MGYNPSNEKMPLDYNMKITSQLLHATLFIISMAPTLAAAADWSVPLAGNAFESSSTPGRRLFNSGGGLRLADPPSVASVYFHVDRPGELELAIRGRVMSGSATVQARVNDQVFSVDMKDASEGESVLGEVTIPKPGYVRVDLQIAAGAENGSVELSELRVASDTDGMKLDYVRNNEGNMFYWGRRGPSVHLSYMLPSDTALSHAYSEITVPEGQDVIGSYFMANGFGEGYFGIQVNSRDERRVLFSVWSPFKTDNPADIPDADRIVTLAKGTNVKAQDFGNEGSGGQSYLVYPWKAGVTYRFLTEVKPDGNGNTLYTSWFGEKQADEWQLIASFHRPKTDKHLTGFHSFLENFAPDYGNRERTADYGNAWVRSVDGNWHEITRARFTGDATARGRHRIDYAGGSRGNVFFLKHCGFFDGVATEPSLDQTLERAANSQPPTINFEELPRS